MDKIKKGLGRGLSSLIGETKAVPIKNQLSISDIVPNKYQPRKIFEETNLEDLANSIKERGIIQPIIVRKSNSDNSKYEIIAGERANYLVRSGFAQSMAQFDSYGTQGLDYWMENVAPLMNNVGGTEYFSHADDASFDDAEPGTNKIWKVLHYNVKRNSGPDFWKFRTRVAKAAEKVGNLSLCLLYTSPSPRDLSTSRMPSSA